MRLPECASQARKRPSLDTWHLGVEVRRWSFADGFVQKELQPMRGVSRDSHSSSPLCVCSHCPALSAASTYLGKNPTCHPSDGNLTLTSTRAAQAKPRRSALASTSRPGAGGPAGPLGHPRLAPSMAPISLGVSFGGSREERDGV